MVGAAVAGIDSRNDPDSGSVVHVHLEEGVADAMDGWRQLSERTSERSRLAGAAATRLETYKQMKVLIASQTALDRRVDDLVERFSR